MLAMSSSGCATFDLLPDLFGAKQTTTAQTDTQTNEPGTQGTTEQTVLASVESKQEIRTSSTATDSSQVSDLWQVVRDTQRLKAITNKRIKRQIAWYQKYNRTLERVSINARPFLYYIQKEVRRRQLPSELALIPVIESAFRPLARSPSGATGLWQFIASTGKRYGLAQTWWYDGRRDVVASTQAAFDYLEYLERQFEGDWLLAIAAYNAGEGNVHAAIKRNAAAGKETDYWSLKLPKETLTYVPRLLALAQIVKQPEVYGLKINAIDNRPYFREVDLRQQTDLTVAARLAGVSVDELRQINPGYKQWATPPEGPHRLLIPYPNVAAFNDSLAKLPSGEQLISQRHLIANGETLGGIARRYNTTVAALQQLNKLSSTRIRAGRTLLVPTSGKRSGENATVAATISDTDNSARLQHTVRSGDSLWAIARQYGATVSELVAWNNISKHSTLRLGQKITIRSSAASTVPTTLQPNSEQSPEKLLSYTVTRGDSLWEISKRFGVSVVALRKWNNLAKGKLLQPGQRLKVYVEQLDQARL